MSAEKVGQKPDTREGSEIKSTNLPLYPLALEFFFLPPEFVELDGKMTNRFILRGKLCRINYESQQIILPRTVRPNTFGSHHMKGFKQEFTRINPNVPYQVRIGMQSDAFPQILFIPYNLTGERFPNIAIQVDKGAFIAYLEKIVPHYNVIFQSQELQVALDLLRNSRNIVEPRNLFQRRAGF